MAMNDLELFNIHTEIFSKSEYDLLMTPKSNEIACYPKDDCNKLVSSIGIPNYEVYVDETETNLINQVFDMNISDDTLVVISDKEHPSILYKAIYCKNLLIIPYEDIKMMKTESILEKYRQCKAKEIFISIIGTSFIDGIWIPDTYFIKIKNDLDKIPHKILVDDAQSLFVVNRNYYIYDYILGTAHAIVKEFDMGVMLTKHKQNNFYGKDAYNWVSEYIKRLYIILPKIRYYNLDYLTKMKDLFSVFLESGKIELETSVPHIFSMKINEPCSFTNEELDKLDTYNINVFTTKNNYNIRFRFADTLQSTGFKEGVMYLIDLLNKKVYNG